MKKKDKTKGSWLACFKNKREDKMRGYKKQIGQSGQSLLETLIVCLSLTSFIQFTVLLFWMGISVLWIEHQLYQALVCRAEHKGLEHCKQSFFKNTKKLSPVGTIENIKITNFNKQWKGELLWRFFKKDFLIQQTLNLPK